MKKRTKSYHDSLIKSLKDPKEAAAYLNAVLESDDNKMFLVSLRNVSEAYGGMARLSRLAKLNRANLYKILSENGRPEFQSIHRVLAALGLKLTVSAIPTEKFRRAA